MFTSLAGPASGFGGAVAGELLLHAAGVDVPAESSMSLRRRQLDAAEPVRLPAGGSPLPRAVRRRMERALGRDLGVVRIHTGADAARAAEALSAHAAAVGAHVFFGAGEWQPGTPRGDRLIAHELTHVVQHLDNRLPSGGGVSDPSDPAEVEAYAAEDRVLAQLPLIDAIDRHQPCTDGHRVVRRRSDVDLSVSACLELDADRSGGDFDGECVHLNGGRRSGRRGGSGGGRGSRRGGGLHCTRTELLGSEMVLLL